MFFHELFEFVHPLFIQFIILVKLFFVRILRKLHSMIKL